MREGRDAWSSSARVGGAQKELMPTEPLLAELQAASPEVAAEFERRLKAKKVPSFADVQQNWPEARQRILEDRKEALLSDLYSPAD